MLLLHQNEQYGIAFYYPNLSQPFYITNNPIRRYNLKIYNESGVPD